MRPLTKISLASLHIFLHTLADTRTQHNNRVFCLFLVLCCVRQRIPNLKPNPNAKLDLIDCADLQAASDGPSCWLEGQCLVSDTADLHATPGGTNCLQHSRSHTLDDRCHNVCICITSECGPRTTPYPSGHPTEGGLAVAQIEQVCLQGEGL